MKRREFIRLTLLLSAGSMGLPLRAAPSQAKGTGLLWDPQHGLHDLAGHPENAARINATLEVLRQRALIDVCSIRHPKRFSEKILLLAHKPRYIEKIKALGKSKSGGYVHGDKWSSYFTPATFEVAGRAAQGLSDLCTEVAEGKLKNGFALIRPPGHHATADRAMGFCVFNNVAVAAKNLLAQGGKVGKVAIVDVDAHHGNGIQDICQGDPRILYISTHQKDWFPFSGTIHEKGNVMNLPLPNRAGDVAFARVMEQAIKPKLKQFKPDFIIVCAGYDAHWRDYMADLSLSMTGIDRLHQGLIESAKEISESRIVFALEGGYNLQAVGHGVANTLSRLTGGTKIVDPLGFPSAPGEPDISDLIRDVRRIHSLST